MHNFLSLIVLLNFCCHSPQLKFDRKEHILEKSCVPLLLGVSQLTNGVNYLPEMRLVQIWLQEAVRVGVISYKEEAQSLDHKLIGDKV